MVDIVVAPALVVAGGNVSRFGGIAGETIAQGKACFISSTTGKIMLADNDSVTPELRQAVGISLNSASLDQPIEIGSAGDIALSGTGIMTAGLPYYLSANPGGICPQADLVAGKTVCLLGIAKTTTVLAVEIQFPGVTL